MFVALNSAMFNLSGFNYCVLDWLRGANAAAVRRSFFMGYAALAAGLALGALTLLPRPRRRDTELLLGSEGGTAASTATTLWQEACSPPLAARTLREPARGGSAPRPPVRFAPPDEARGVREARTSAADARRRSGSAGVDP